MITIISSEQAKNRYKNDLSRDAYRPQPPLPNTPNLTQPQSVTKATPFAEKKNDIRRIPFFVISLPSLSKKENGSKTMPDAKCVGRENIICFSFLPRTAYF